MNNNAAEKVRNGAAFKSLADCGKKNADIIYLILGIDNSLLQMITAKQSTNNKP
jgi:hypothetical protein